MLATWLGQLPRESVFMVPGLGVCVRPRRLWAGPTIQLHKHLLAGTGRDMELHQAGWHLPLSGRHYTIWWMAGPAELLNEFLDVRPKQR